MLTTNISYSFQDMQKILFPVALLLPTLVCAQEPKSSKADWLINSAPYLSRVTPDAKGGEVELNNGLVRRVIKLKPNAATVAFDNLMTGASILRAVRPEAEVEIGGTIFPVGGLEGQPIQNYLEPNWLTNMTSVPDAYVFDHFEIGPTKARFPWKKHLEWMPRDLPWPPPGKSLTLYFKPPSAPTTTNGSRIDLPSVQIHYEIYDGIPLITKWLTVSNDTPKTIRLNKFVCEILAAVEGESIVDDTPTWRVPGTSR